MPRRTSVVAAFAASAVLTISIAACSSKPTQSVTPPPGGGTADVNAYLRGLPAWASTYVLETAAHIPHPTDPVTADMASGVLCTTAPFKIVQNPEALSTMDPSPGILFLGSLLQGDSYAGNSTAIDELPIRQRAPLRIAIDPFTGTQIDTTVPDPDAVSVQAHLNQLVAKAAAAGVTTAGDAEFEMVESYSAEQAALSLNVSYKYLGTSARGALNVSRTDEKRTVTAYFKQVMFRAFIVRPQEPVDFFTTDFTKAKLDEQVALGNIGPANLPVYVASIEYGRTLMYSMTFESSIQNLDALVSASYKGVAASASAELKAEIEKVLSESTIKVHAIGGSQTNIEGLIKSGNLQAYFQTNDPLTSAAPLTYKLVNLADGKPAQISEKADYDRRGCLPDTVDVYTNESEWENAVNARVQGVTTFIWTFQTSAPLLPWADEVLVAPTPNTNMGHLLTFDLRPAPNFWPFKWTLQSLVGGTHSGLIYMDQESGPAFGAMDQERSISIGDVDDVENDNFAIKIPLINSNAAVFAIGISVGDNSVESDEGVWAFGVGNFEFTSPISLPTGGVVGFLGIVSTVPLQEFGFNEGNSGDDIFVRDPRFGVLQW